MITVGYRPTGRSGAFLASMLGRHGALRGSGFGAENSPNPHPVPKGGANRANPEKEVYSMSIPKSRYNKGIPYEDFDIGEEYVSASRTLTESDIWLFACWSGDANPLHTDEEFCKTGPFGGRIAHGLLTTCIGTGLANQTLMFEGTTMALLNSSARYTGIARAGDTLRVVVRVTDKKDTKKYKDRGIVTFDWTVYNQRDEAICEAQWVLMIKRKEELKS
jgi:acyl dehydratase